MKTAMQDLIEYLESRYFDWEITEVLQKSKELLEKEKEQIIDAYNQGTLDGESSILQYPNYYNQTYNK